MDYVHKDNGFAVTVLSETPNSVSFAPKGGGFVYRIPKALFQLDFEPQEVKEPTWRKAWFTWDGAERKWEGYTRWERWNGWECPMFTLEVAQDIAALTQAEEGDKIVYAPDKDCFIHTNYGDTEGYPQTACSTLIDGRFVRLYEVADGWCWDEVKAPVQVPEYMLDPIGSAGEARAFLTRLFEEDKLFHLDDSPNTIIDSNGNPLFSDEEAQALDLRVQEVCSLLGDPFPWCLWIMKRFEITWEEGYGEHDGKSEEHPATWFNYDNGFDDEDLRSMDETLVGDTIHLGAPWALVSIRRTQ